MAHTQTQILVLGGGYAGVLAASRLAGQLGDTARIRLISDRGELVHRIRLHELLAGRPYRRYPLRRLLPASVELIRARVTRLDAETGRVALEGQRELHADFIIVAIGSRLSSRAPGAPEHASWLASPEQALAGAARLRRLSAGSRVTVVGGGLTAIEAAAEIAEAHRDLRVTLLTQSLAPGLSETGRRYVQSALSELGIELRTETVASVDSGAVITASGEHVPSQLTVWAAGFVANGPALESDLARDALGRLIVGPDLRAQGSSRVFVVGDAAAPGPGLEHLRMSCAAALPMGAHAADTIVRLVRGEPAQEHSFAFVGQCVSLGRERGLIQMVDGRDNPLPRVITGRAGALVKECVCRFVIGALRVERLWAGAYRWPRLRLPAGELGPRLSAGHGH